MIKKMSAYIKSLDRTVAVTQIVFNPNGQPIYIFSADTGQDHYGHDVDLIVDDGNVDLSVYQVPKSHSLKVIKMINKETGFTGYVNKLSSKVKSINPETGDAIIFTTEQANDIASSIDKNKYLVSIEESEASENHS